MIELILLVVCLILLLAVAVVTVSLAFLLLKLVGHLEQMLAEIQLMRGGMRRLLNSRGLVEPTPEDAQ